MDDSWWEPMCPSQMVLQSESASVKFEAKNSLKLLAIKVGSVISLLSTLNELADMLALDARTKDQNLVPLLESSAAISTR